MAPDLEPKVTLPWLVRLRWWAAAAQIAALVVSRFGLSLDLGWPALLGVVAVTLATNLGVKALVRVRPNWSAAGILGGVLALDVLLLTVMLAASGGPLNPFTVIYLVHITLSAVALSAAWTTLIAVLSIAGFGALFVLAPSDPHAHHHGALAHHLEGMWIAFVLAAGLTAFFVRRIALAIARQREQLEVERCREILGQMAARASETREGPKLLSSEDLGRRIQSELGAAHSRVVIELEQDAPSMRVPVEPLLQSVLALVRNAIDASRPEQPVTIRAARADDRIQISIADRGTGIPGALLERIGEPFFTTKQPGRGIGLGVFLARAFAESQGGALTIDSAEGHGTRATLSLPASVTA